MRSRFPATLFVLLLVAACLLIISTSGALPERIASHFDAAGSPNDFMTRDAYRVFMLAFGIGFPLLLVALISWVPRLLPDLTNIPNRAHWMAPERRASTCATLHTYALWLGSLLTVFLAGVHWLVVRANAVSPPRLENGPFMSLLLAFFVALIVWTLMMVRQFRNTS